MPEAVVEAFPEHRPLGLRQARRIPEPVVEVADCAVELDAVDAGANEPAGELERLERVLVPGPDLRVGRADRERPGHVGEARALDVVREEVADEVVVVRDAAGARVVPVRRLRAVRDDQVVAAAAVLGEDVHGGRPQELAGERLAVHDPTPVGRLRPREEIGDRRHARLAGTGRAPDPVELGLGLPAPAVVEEALVRDELDSGAAERVRRPERERLGDAGAPDPEGLDDLHGDRRFDVVEVDARADQLVRRERLDRDDLDRRVDDGDPVALDAPYDGDAAPADLRIDEGVPDVDRDLVTELRTPHRVTEDQDVGHEVEPTLPRVGWHPWSRPSSTCGHASPRSPI